MAKVNVKNTSGHPVDADGLLIAAGDVAEVDPEGRYTQAAIEVGHLVEVGEKPPAKSKKDEEG